MFAAAAAQLVSVGRAISCSRPINTHSGPANPYPARHLVAVHDSGEMADFLSMFVHGFADTHLDALCHLSAAEPELTWNGKELDGYHMPAAHTGTIDFWRDGIVTRGVLVRHPAAPRHHVRRGRRTRARVGARRRGCRAGCGAAGG